METRPSSMSAAAADSLAASRSRRPKRVRVFFVDADATESEPEDSFYPFASPTSVLRHELLPPAFDLLYSGLGELCDLAAAPTPSSSSKAAEFDCLPWWESEDFVTPTPAGLTAATNAVSVK